MEGSCDCWFHDDLLLKILESIESIGRIWRACKKFGAQGAGKVGVMCWRYDVCRVSPRTRQATPSVARTISRHRMKIEETVYKELNRNIASLIPGLRWSV